MEETEQPTCWWCGGLCYGDAETANGHDFCDTGCKMAYLDDIAPEEDNDEQAN